MRIRIKNIGKGDPKKWVEEFHIFIKIEFI